MFVYEYLVCIKYSLLMFLMLIYKYKAAFSGLVMK